ncbi:MAG: helix-turn-helix transcriptional regulator [Bacteroidota bacterium]
MSKIPVYEIQNFNYNVANSELYVNSFKEHLKAHHFIEKPHRHNFYLLVLFTHGSGTHEIDFNQYEVKKGSLFILQPGQIHHWNLSDDSDGYIVFYSQEVYNLYFGNKQIEDYAFFQSAESKPEIVLNEKELLEIDGYFSKMHEESQGFKSKRIDKILNLLDTINIELSRRYISEDHHESHLYNYKIKEFKKILEQHFIFEKSPSFYASKMNISLKHLNRICKIILNKTATEIITYRVVLEAKRLLIHPNKSISQIADELQFINYSYFAKLFKKQTGISPSDFRNKLQ